MNGSRVIFTLACATAWLFCAGCDASLGVDAVHPSTPIQQKPAAATTPSAATPLRQAAIKEFQAQLLDIAFGSATRIPIDPHVKDRSRAQEAVADACLTLNQSDRASGYIDQIADWRRGAALADLACHLAQHSESIDRQRIQALLDRAADAASHADDWRRDRINVKIARAYTLLGELDKAGALERGASPAEAGALSKTRAMRVDDKGFSAQLATLEQALNSGNFDAQRNALDACVELIAQMYGDSARRTLVDQKIRSAWHTVPVEVRIDVLTKLARTSLEHDDRAAALLLVNEAQDFVLGSQWTPDFEIAVTARLAALRHKAGDHAKARTQVDAARSKYELSRPQILTTDRAATLRSIAEAYQDTGDAAAALAIYKKAAEEGAANVNARPRAIDLSALCCSMALHNAEPDSELWEHIRRINGGLTAPW